MVSYDVEVLYPHALLDQISWQMLLATFQINFATTLTIFIMTSAAFQTACGFAQKIVHDQLIRRQNSLAICSQILIRIWLCV